MFGKWQGKVFGKWWGLRIWEVTRQHLKKAIHVTTGVSAHFVSKVVEALHISKRPK